LPRKKGRQKRIAFLSRLPGTVVLYESPHRVDKTLEDLAAAFGNRAAALARELTKLHEEILRGGLDDLRTAHRGRKWKGEITLVIAGTGKIPDDPEEEE